MLIFTFLLDELIQHESHVGCPTWHYNTILAGLCLTIIILIVYIVIRRNGKKLPYDIELESRAHELKNQSSSRNGVEFSGEHYGRRNRGTTLPYTIKYIVHVSTKNKFYTRNTVPLYTLV